LRTHFFISSATHDFDQFKTRRKKQRREETQGQKEKLCKIMTQVLNSQLNALTHTHAKISATAAKIGAETSPSDTC
jgi:ferritin-like metal-binding protein YciE